MSKKKITAPLSYDPGKGRPKEHLAYLNWQEMQELKRINGNNQERGPMGLPSFPPADAIGSSSKAKSSTTSSKMGKSSTQTGAKAKGSQVGAQKASTQTGLKGSQVGAQKSSTQGLGSKVSKAATGMTRAAQTGTQKASKVAGVGSAIKSGAKTSLSAARTPAQATGKVGTKTVNVGPMGTPVGVKTGGTQIKGAIQRAQQPITYTQAPRYRQPQAERMANPTAVPAAQRSVYERMNAAEAEKSMRAALDARVQRANQMRQATVDRAGVFGAPSYTGMYNPKTGKFDAPPVAAPYRPAPQTVDRTGMRDYGPVLPSGTEGVWGGIPQTVDRTAKGQYQGIRPSGTETEWGGPTVDVANRAIKTDLPAPSRTISDTISDYAGSAYDTISGGIRDIGDALPPNVFTPRYPSTFTDKIGPRVSAKMQDRIPATDLIGPKAPAKFQDRIPATPQASTLAPKAPRNPEEEAMAERLANLNRFEQEARSIAERDPSTFATPAGLPNPFKRGSIPQFRQDIVDAAAGYQRQGAGIPRAPVTEISIPYEGGRVPTAPARPLTTEQVSRSALSMYNPTIGETAGTEGAPYVGPRTKAERIKMNKMYKQYLSDRKIVPMGDTVDGETILSVEDMPESLNAVGYKRIPTKENLLPFQERTYDSPYPVDENGIPVQDISAADLAKIRSRRRGEEYVQTPEEKKAALAGKVVSGVITKELPGAGKFFNVEENIEDYQSRPSWEKEYIKQRAEEAGGIKGIGAGRSSSEREVRGGIGGLPTKAPTTPTAPSAESQPSGSRPYIHYQWDVGVNIPSPSDPNYTQYQKYLSDRAARRAALGMA